MSFFLFFLLKSEVSLYVVLLVLYPQVGSFFMSYSPSPRSISAMSANLILFFSSVQIWKYHCADSTFSLNPAIPFDPTFSLKSKHSNMMRPCVPPQGWHFLSSWSRPRSSTVWVCGRRTGKKSTKSRGMHSLLKYSIDYQGGGRWRRTQRAKSKPRCGYKSLPGFVTYS